MKITAINTDFFQSNIYIISSDDYAVIIDPSGTQKFYNKIKDYLEGRQLKAVLFTHGHFDHIALGHEFEGKVPMYIHKLDSQMLYTAQPLGKKLGLETKPFHADNNMEGGEQLKFGDITVKVRHTPGHTKGSVCYVIDNNIFSGDTLFKDGIGRTDLGGSFKEIIQSIESLFSLKGDYTVYPGHGEPTTLRYEQKNNPYI